MAMTISTDEAVQMLQAGWTVRYFAKGDCIEWRSPSGLSGSDYLSESLDRPPKVAVQRAIERGELVPRDRTPA